MEWVTDHLPLSWLMLAIVFGALELVSLDLVFLMLAGGALAGMVAAFAGAVWWAQVLVAIVTSVASLAVLRPSLLRRLHQGDDLQIGAAALVSREALVLEELSTVVVGRVQIGGETWSAQAHREGDHYSPGDQVVIVEIVGATAVVTALP